MTQQVNKAVTDPKRKFLLVLPVFLIPFVTAAFFGMDGGKGTTFSRKAYVQEGLIMELPRPMPDKKETGMNKLSFYRKADEDSLRRRAFILLDPYARRMADTGFQLRPIGSSITRSNLPSPENRADNLLQKLRQLRRQVQQGTPVPVHQEPPRALIVQDSSHLNNPGAKLERLVRSLQSVQEGPVGRDSAGDPQLEKLNGMLDKIIRIQHPAELAPSKTEEKMDTVNAGLSAIPALVEEKQTLVNGTTIALRLPEGGIVGGNRLPRNQLIYGSATLHNDRMLIVVNSIRCDQSIYPVALQAYDLDGLAGIHIPGMMSREVAKESADQGINSLNLATYDPTIGGQAAVAGIQAAKSLFSRKVKQVRVFVPAGYRVLLRSVRAMGKPDTYGIPDSSHAKDKTPPYSGPDILPANAGDMKAYLHQRVKQDKMSLVLRGVYLRDHVMWLSLLLKNKSLVDYTPDHIRCFVRDRRQFRRTAIQEVPLYPEYEHTPVVLSGRTEEAVLVGFRPFALARDKKMALQLDDKDGSRQLELFVDSQTLLNAKMVGDDREKVKVDPLQVGQCQADGAGIY